MKHVRFSDIEGGPHIKRLIDGHLPYIEIEPLRLFRVRYDREARVAVVSGRCV